MKIKIAADIDDSSVDFTFNFLNFYNNKYRTHFTKEKCYIAKLETILGISKDKIRKEFDEFYNSPFFDAISPIAHAPAILYLLNKINGVPFLTFRPVNIKDKTKISMEKLFPESYSSIIHSREFGKSKSEICKDMGISVLIEDYFPNALECSLNGINVLLFNQPWNKNFNLENTLITRFYDWRNVPNIIEKIENKIMTEQEIQHKYKTRGFA
ncbi:hypothetical protein M0R19_00010 [Candidatus Pacearchaeota archaeon]|nr:hypothetical protein [Candidatus Pacearchaeota archaeon]